MPTSVASGCPAEACTRHLRTLYDMLQQLHHLLVADRKWLEGHSSFQGGSCGLPYQCTNVGSQAVKPFRYFTSHMAFKSHQSQSDDARRAIIHWHQFSHPIINDSPIYLLVVRSNCQPPHMTRSPNVSYPLPVGLLHPASRNRRGIDSLCN